MFKSYFLSNLRNFKIKPFYLLPFFLMSIGNCTPFTFSKGSDGWEGGFADYPVGAEHFYELAWGWENLPTEVTSRSSEVLSKGLFLAGNNHSDDLFMFVKRQIDGLEPNAEYSARFSVLIESNVPEGLAGIGGSPGESVFFKVGASTVEPVQQAENGFYVLNVDKGNQSGGGAHAKVIGNLANRDVDPDNRRFLPKELSGEEISVMADQEGKIWIFLGTDSGFEGITKFYVAKVEVHLTHQR